MNDSPKAASATSFWYSEDAVAIFLAWTCLGVILLATFSYRPAAIKELVAEHEQLRRSQATASDQEAVEIAAERVERIKKIEAQLGPIPFKDWWFKASDWSRTPWTAFQSKQGDWLWRSWLVTGTVLAILLAAGHWWRGQSPQTYLPAFVGLFLLATIALAMSSQATIKYANLEYPLWALLLGLIVSNTIGVPHWLRPAVSPELYVKTGLVLLGAEVLFGKLLMLGIPGMLVSWTVTPIVLVATYIFGQRVLKMESRALNMVISADMSVCGVSAAIATAAACRAKKEELSLAIALSLVFTVVMMVVMPLGIQAVGMNDVIAGAWLGGTIDSTGAVAAASELLKSPAATEVATTIKMIQNILIGVFAFAIAAYWATFVEAKDTAGQPRPTAIGWYEIWRRFPKFALGFLLTSLACSWLQSSGVLGSSLISAVVDGSTKHLRAWFFCLAFVAIGLDSNFRQYLGMLRSGKPVVLYLVGQALNLTLSLAMAYLVFGYLFREATQALQR
jgi:uncharacterized membrane protein YadS